MITLAEVIESMGINLVKTGEVMPSSSTPAATSAASSTTSGGSSSVIYLNNPASNSGSSNDNEEADSSSKPGITGSAIKDGELLSGSQLIAVTVILCITFVVFLVISSTTLIKIKEKH
jgi:hypothetical protein